MFLTQNEPGMRCIDNLIAESRSNSVVAAPTVGVERTPFRRRVYGKIENYR
jgi:hypothetical protein